MRSWLSANWLNVAVVLAIIGTVSGWTNAARHKGMADAEAAAKVRALQDLGDAADSVTAARARAHRANLRAEQQREAHDSVVARLSARIADLSAAHDSLQAAAERELEEHDGWLSREMHEAVVSNLESSLLLTDSLRAEAEDLARTERERGDALEVTVGALMAQVGVLTEITETQEREIEALRKANAAGGIFPDFGIVTKPLYFAVGAGLGYLGGRLTR